MKNNKALIGIGIGCGALVLMGSVALIGGVFWVKNKVSGAAQMVEQIAAQEEQIKAIDKKYPFTAPPDGKPLKLDEKRVQDYLAIRASLVPVFKNFEAQSKALEARHPTNQGALAGLEALGMTGDLLRDVRAKYIEQLDAKRMSSIEFHTITGAIYASYLGKGVAELRQGQRDVLERTIGELDKQLASKSLPNEQRKLLTQQRETLAKQLAGLPPKGTTPSEDMAIYGANTALLDKYKAQIEKEANPALDVFLFGDASGMEKAFKPLQEVAR